MNSENNENSVPEIKDKKGKSEKESFFKKHPVFTAFIKGLLFFLIFFSIGEMGVKYYVDKTRTLPKHEGGFEFRPHPIIYWRLRPHLNMLMKMPKGGEFMVETNSRGIRNDEIPMAKPAGGYRIQCYGDSITYGHGVDKEYTYESQLQHILREKHTDKSIDVMNFGCPGYTSYQGWYLFRKLGVRYDPNLCILGFSFADPSAEEVSDFDRASKSPIVQFIQENLYMSELYLALRQAKIKNVDIYGKSDTVMFTSVRVSEVQYREIMEAWAAEMKKRNGHVIFLGLAMTQPDPFEYYENYRKICKEVAEGTGNYFIDMNQVFREREQNLNKLFLLSIDESEYVDRIHPNEEGFKIMAETIGDLIEKENLIK